MAQTQGEDKVETAEKTVFTDEFLAEVEEDNTGVEQRVVKKVEDIDSGA